MWAVNCRQCHKNNRYTLQNAYILENSFTSSSHAWLMLMWDGLHSIKLQGGILDLVFQPSVTVIMSVNGATDKRILTCLAWSSSHRCSICKQHKTAELSQRRPRDAPNIWMPWKALRVLTTHPATFPEICNGLLLRSILRMCVQKLKFVALPVPEIIWGTQKNWGSPWICPRSIFSQIFNRLLFDGPSEYICQIWRS